MGGAVVVEVCTLTSRSKTCKTPKPSSSEALQLSPETLQAVDPKPKSFSFLGGPARQA